MYILTSNEIKEIEKHTFKVLGLPSSVVMETAGRRVVSIVSILSASEKLSNGPIVVCVGTGNNGGDGFVIARVLKSMGYVVIVASSKSIESLSGDARVFADVWCATQGDTIVFDPNDVEHRAMIAYMLENSSVIVDAILGTGYKGKLKKAVAAWISLINAAGKPIISVDIPSGVDASTGEIDSEAVNADCTVTFDYPKVGHVLYPGASYCGDVIMSNVGIEMPQAYHPNTVKLFMLGDARELLDDMQELRGDSSCFHKGDKGRVLVVGGAMGMCGAVKLCAGAAMATGAGLVTLAVPNSVANVLAPQLMEFMCCALCDDGNGEFSGEDTIERLRELVKGKDAIVVGPGLGRGAGATKLLKNLLRISKENDISTIIDADAINAIALHDDSAEFDINDAAFAITPHHAEAARLLKCEVEAVEFDRLWAARELSKKYTCDIVLKGARTIVITDEGSSCSINPTSTNVLATAGSGDVLSGMIAAFCAGGMILNQACCLGVFVHGVVGEMLEQELEKPFIGAIASDIISNIPNAINYIYSATSDDKSEFRVILPGAMHRRVDEVIDKCLRTKIKDFCYAGKEEDEEFLSEDV